MTDTDAVPALLIGTDGACSGNPGPAGWAWVAADGRSNSGGTARGTNQMAELNAILLALRDLGDVPLTIQTDSAYAVGCASTWKAGWQRRSYLKPDGKQVLNLDVIRPLHELLDRRQARLSFVKVKGHDPDNRWPLNTIADEMAVRAAAGAAIRARDRSISELGLASSRLIQR